MKGRFIFRYDLFPDALKIFLLALILVFVSFLLQGRIGLNLADEGYLWYGALRTSLGDVPVRDFQSYDPGRYYWAAAWSMLFGGGIISLRMAAAIFQVLGLTFGLLALRRVIRSWWMTAAASILLLVWMHPWYKIFDHCIAMAAVYFALQLIEKPSLLRHFTAGVFVGAGAFWGRNHGLYGLAAFFLLILFTWFKNDRGCLSKRIAAWGSGMLVGYSPLLFMFVQVPDFFNSFLESIMFLFRSGSTNLTLPVPWPWSVDLSHTGWLSALGAFSTGMFFLMLPVSYAVAGAFLLGSKRDALQRKKILVAAVFVGAPYIHYTFSRADLAHLALGIHPFLIGVLSLPFVFDFRHKFQGLITRSLLALLFFMSVLSAGTASPYYVKAGAAKEEFVNVDIAGEKIWVERHTAGLIDCVKRINRNYVKPGEELLIAPHWPSFYPLLRRKSPLWDIYFLFKETEERQNKMIMELKENNVNWVILGDVPLDGRDDLRFSNTHPLVWRHFRDDFDIVHVDGLPGDHRLLHRKMGPSPSSEAPRPCHLVKTFPHRTHKPSLPLYQYLLRASRKTGEA